MLNNQMVICEKGQMNIPNRFWHAISGLCTGDIPLKIDMDPPNAFFCGIVASLSLPGEGFRALRDTRCGCVDLAQVGVEIHGIFPVETDAAAAWSESLKQGR